MRSRKRHLLLRRLVLGVAIAAIAAPSALGRPDGPGNGGSGVLPTGQAAGVIGSRGGGGEPPPGGRLVLRRDPAAAEPARLNVRQAPRAIAVDGRATTLDFDWASVGIGFGAAALLGLLGGGTALSLRHRGRLAAGA